MANDFNDWIDGAPIVPTNFLYSFDDWNDGSPVPLYNFWYESANTDLVLVTPVPWPGNLPLPLINSSQVGTGTDTRIQMETGRFRQVPLIDTMETAAVQWLFTEDQYSQFREFWHNDMQDGTIPVTLSIYGTLRACAFVEATYTWSRTDNVFAVSASLEMDVALYTLNRLLDA